MCGSILEIMPCSPFLSKIHTFITTHDEKGSLETMLTTRKIVSSQFPNLNILIAKDGEYPNKSNTLINNNDYL